MNKVSYGPIVISFIIWLHSLNIYMTHWNFTKKTEFSQNSFKWRPFVAFRMLLVASNRKFALESAIYNWNGFSVFLPCTLKIPGMIYLPLSLLPTALRWDVVHIGFVFIFFGFLTSAVKNNLKFENKTYLKTHQTQVGPLNVSLSIIIESIWKK